MNTEILKNKAVIAFHKLNCLDENLMRYVEKQVVLKQGLSIFNFLLIFFIKALKINNN